MNNEEAKALYGQAMECVGKGAFAEALAILDELDKARPNSRHVTLHRARCLAELGRLGEAEECCAKGAGFRAVLEGSIEAERLGEVRAIIGSARSRSGAQFTPVPGAEDARWRAAGGEGAANVFGIESSFPVSTEETTVTGHVRSGLFRTGDTVTLVSPDGAPLDAPILRIGTAETPLNLVRAGQQAVMLLKIEPNQVVAGSTATSAAQEMSYAATMVVSTEEPGGGASAAHAPELVDAEKLLRHGNYGEAKSAIEAYLERDPDNYVAHRLLARVYLEGDDRLQDTKQSLERIRKAYELGGAEDPAVIDTLAQALAANGEAAQGLRFLERLYAGNLGVEARMALGQRIYEYRSRHQLGHSWEFADSYGEIVLEAGDPAEIVKAIETGILPSDAKCRRDRVGEWRNIKEALAPEYPQIAALYQTAKSGAGAMMWALVAVLFMAALAVLVLTFVR